MSRPGDRNEAFDRSMASLSAQLAARFARNEPADDRREEVEEDARIAAPRSFLLLGFLAVSLATALAAGGLAFFPAKVPPTSPAPPKVVAGTLPSPPPATDTRSSILDPAPAVAPSPPPPPPSQPIDVPLGRGEILDVQTRLKALGLNPGPLDGVAGSMTVAAAKRYAESRGRSWTGAIDRALLDALQQEPPGRR